MSSVLSKSALDCLFCYFLDNLLNEDNEILLQSYAEAEACKMILEKVKDYVGERDYDILISAHNHLATEQMEQAYRQGFKDGYEIVSAIGGKSCE